MRTQPGPHRCASAYLAVAYFAVKYDARLNVNLIRSWVHRGKVPRVGTDQFGHAMYDLDALERHARARATSHETTVM